MIASPNYWSAAIIRFAKKRYFHWFEVSSRFITGILFVLFSADTLYPNVIIFIGYLLIAVSIGLIVTGEAKHR
ncbi:hypothetical protein [Thalassotalea crassostreae]|uniref:hypothetical protein n=1 Tax=Thalassotalea crassostreae TaxID=1763536 RepID=UPI0009EE0C6A|nr:hypothetical protein [Thalassotalea crassostreae]